ncbi:uncharacterized protein CXorf49 homolog [Marmota marmota marmota]|uniref:uncharacterized protein CXorf49 homolog n=1 Tax=Marmota marmota marmota TaxID=9994 RepID=UPI0020938542|nr:uncharacterized protein CXorf49 homolog [Marmota marmota marmota]
MPSSSNPDCSDRLSSKLATWISDMSSTKEASVLGDGFVPDRETCTSMPGVGHRGPRRLGLGQDLELGPPCSGDGEGGLPDLQDFEFNLEGDWEEMEAGNMVLRGCEARPNSPTDEGACWDLMPHLTIEPETIIQELTGWEPCDSPRYLYPDSSAAERSTIWANTEVGLRGRGVQALSSLEMQPALAAPLCHPSWPEGRRAWGNPQRQTRSRIMVNREALQPSVIPEYSDVFNKLQLIRESIYPKGRGQAVFNSSKIPGDTARSTSASAWGNVLHMPVPLMTPAPGTLASAMKKTLEELEAGSSKKMQSVLWGKRGRRHSYLGATASAAASGGLPRASPKKKPIQEKKSLRDGSKVTLVRTFPSWGQRIKAAPLEPATFPSVSGIPLLEISKRHSLLPLEPKQAKHSDTGKRSIAKKTWQSQLVACEDSGLSRDAVPQAHFSMHWPGTPAMFMHPGEIGRSDPNTRVSQPPGSSQTWDLGQGGLISRAPAPFDDQASAVRPLIRERQEQPHGALGCPWCVALQKERDDLKEQLAAMQSLMDKFQAL